MERRTFLSGWGAVAAIGLAGCSGDPETEGDDDNPIQKHPEELILDIQDFDDEGWYVSADGGDSEHHKSATFSRVESTTQQIGVNVWVFESVSEAKEDYQSRVDDVIEQYSTNESDIAVEGITWERGRAYSLFRDANAIGRVSHVEVIADDASPSVSTALDYSATTHRKWR